MIVDVVYNHLGPGSEALTAFGPYLSKDVQTFWGAGLDFSQAGVREWAIQNALCWVEDYGIDGYGSTPFARSAILPRNTCSPNSPATCTRLLRTRS